MAAVIKSDKKVITGWCFYDWANSVYALVMTATIFPIYYNEVTSSEAGDLVSFFGRTYINTELYAYSLSAAFLIVALISPYSLLLRIIPGPRRSS